MFLVAWASRPSISAEPLTRKARARRPSHVKRRMTMNLHREHAQLITRRHFFRRCNSGLGAIALASLMGPNAFATSTGAGDAPNPLASKPPRFPAKAKRVIYLHMSGSPPQHDLFDFKPELNKINGQPCPDSFLAGERFAFIKGHPKCLGT